ncbi:MAG: iron ABC transporter permease [Clostridia bacterium]|nr:iron ABC transporter permease [Clostridia bacterium]
MKYKTRLTYIILGVLLVLSALTSLVFGAVSLSPSELFGAVLQKEGFESARIILFSLRLPRLLSAIVAGAGLALSGAVLQLIMGNELVSPNTIGVNAGAGLAVIISLTALPNLTPLTPVWAFAGAFITLLLIIGFSKGSGGSKSSVVLAGIALSTLFQAGISFFSILDSDVLGMYSAFSVGSFMGVTLNDLLIPSALIILSIAASVILAPAMAALSLGDRIAAGIGVKVQLTRILCLAIAGLSAASVISFAGLLGFVGLIVPHITRRLVGSGTRQYIIASPLIGAILVILSDLAGRCILAPTEIPVGIVMAFIGSPFFLALLLNQRR